MSTSLTVLDNNQALAGVGLGSGLFRIRPMTLELVHKTTRAEGAIPGKFRVVSTNQHFDEMRVVLLDVPQPQRELYQGSEFTKDSKVCFSTDNVKPHPKAKDPKAMFCASCEFGDKNWEKWRRDKRPENLPACSMFYHTFVADRATQALYYFNIKGQGVMPFRQQMEQTLGGILQQLTVKAKMANKPLGWTLSPQYTWEPTPDFVLPEGQTERKAPLPLPNIFDISFTIYVTQRDKGGPFVIGTKDYRYMEKESDRKEFGGLYQEFIINRKSLQNAPVEAEEEQAAADAVVSESPATSAPAPAVVLPSTGSTGPVVGTVVPKEEITI